MAESPNAPERLVPPTNLGLCAENLKKAETSPKPYDLRHQRKPTEAKRSSLLENWGSLYQRHEKSWEKLQKLCNASKDKLSPERIRTLEGDMEELLLQWTGYERLLVDTQSQLGDSTFKEEVQHLKRINKDREKLLQSSKKSLRDELQAKDTPSEKAESEATRRSHAPSQRSHVASSHASKEASSVRPKSHLRDELRAKDTPSEKAESEATRRSHVPSQRSHVASSHASKEALSVHLKSQRSQACTSASQQPSVSGTSRSSKASSSRSHSSRDSRAESLAAQASQAQVEAAAAAASLRVAKEELLEKEEMTKTRAELAIAQARVEFLQRKAEATEIVARAAVLQVKAEGAAFMANFKWPESGHFRLNGRDHVAQQLEQLVSAPWEDDVIGKHSAENYQPSLAPAQKSESMEREPDLWRVRRETQAERPHEPESTTSMEEKLCQLQEERMCKVCMDKDVSVVLVPCGHLVVCGECAPNMSCCPICRGDIRDRMKVFLS